jgi:hypothetical protein
MCISYDIKLQDEASYATQRLADVIMDLHHDKDKDKDKDKKDRKDKTDDAAAIKTRIPKSPERYSPRRKKNTYHHSPQKLSTLGSLNSSPIIKNKARSNSNNTNHHPKASSSARFQTSDSLHEEEDDDDEDDEEEYSYDEDDFDEESNLNISMGNVPLVRFVTAVMLCV